MTQLRESAPKLCLEICSDDLDTSRRAKETLRSLLQPVDLVRQAREDPGTLLCLLKEAEDVRNVDVYNVLGSVLNEAFEHTECGSELVKLDVHNGLPLVHFVLEGLADDRVEIATSLQTSATSLIQGPANTSPEVAKPIAAAIDRRFRCEALLRWFDCDRPSTVKNGCVVRFFREYTTLVDYIDQATTAAFRDDPLMLANYLVLCGVLLRFTTLSDEFHRNLERAMGNLEDDLTLSFACQCCSTALDMHESNATLYASRWIAALLNGEVPERIVDSVCNVLVAALSTSPGWTLVADRLVSRPEILSWLQSRSIAARVSAVHLCAAVLSWQHTQGRSPEVLSANVLQHVWRLHSSHEDDLRTAVWVMAVSAVPHRSDTKGAFQNCVTSFLCGQPEEPLVQVRGLQRRVCEQLLGSADTPDNARPGLERFLKRGLYQSGSVGVASLAV